MKLNEIVQPDAEDLYWKNPKTDDLWALDKLILSKKSSISKVRCSKR